MSNRINELTETVKKAVADYLDGTLYDARTKADEQEKRDEARRELRHALRGCQRGLPECRRFVIDYIQSILESLCGINEDNIKDYIPFGMQHKLTFREKWDILLERYCERYGKDGLIQLAEKYNWMQLREIDGRERYRITGSDVESAYRKERPGLSYMEQLGMLARRVYAEYRGCGILDELLEQNLDGINVGVSGSARSQEEGMRPWDSVWVILEGNTICLSFLGFGSEEEMIRVCRCILSQGNGGQLSRKKGYLVTERTDGSRIAAARPPFGETWTLFLRKFPMARYTSVDSLLSGEGKELVSECIRWIVRGEQVTAVTGHQGTGKTTLLGAMVDYIPEYYNIRVQELSFELHLRDRYPERNIASFRETDSVSGQEGLDFQKKTDGMVHILGEVATARVSNWMIGIAQTASAFTIFTHHAVNTPSLIESLRNNLLMEGGFENESIAQQQVTDVLRFDIHLGRDKRGNRYVERITEIAGEGSTFRLRTLLMRDESGRYRFCQPFSHRMKARITAHLSSEEKEAFYYSCWGQDE